LNVTATDATTAGAGDATVTDAVAVFPEAVAVIVALPAPIAVTSPDAEIVATIGFEELQLTAALGI
jgi:hypothetical protein